jgi:cellulose synthase operon protein C
LFREMPLPGGAVLSRRPPAEAKPLLDNLVHADPNNADLYSLRALEEEQQQDFGGAESDWKIYATRGKDRAAAQLALADFYHRRGRAKDEIAALGEIAQAAVGDDEQFIPAAQQQSWRAFERMFQIIGANGFAADASVKEYSAWIARYPRESQVYSKYFDYLLGQKKFAEAVDLLAQYSRAFPEDSKFAVRARAQLEFRRGNNEQSLAVYDRAFEPLWPRELIDSYFGLLRQTENLRTFLEAGRKALARDPNDLNAATRVFFYYQQENKSDAALAAINEFRAHKESTQTAWSGEELYTLARILDDAHFYAEAARYYFALYNAPKPAALSEAHTSMPGDARELALAGLANILLTAPDEPLRLGAGDLSFYKDVATIDSGPGFLNGILSLLFNSESPQDDFAQEQQRAVPYFHRARAAELIAQLEHDFPDARALPALRARLIGVYRGYAETDVVIRESKRYLSQFPAASERMEVSLELADAYARTHRAEDEFAVYDALLGDLASQAHHLPLAHAQGTLPEDADSESANTQTPAKSKSNYGRVLDRYLARLVSLKLLPRALEVLRHEVDRNPKDPGIYERLAQFLEQNQMDAQIEAVYRRAIEQFPDRSWYQKLARFYLREKRNSDLDALTQQVVKAFAGSELETYFREVGAPGNARLYLQLNLYANRRFPHDLMFVRNLLGAYGTAPTRDPAAREALLRQHWFESDDLRNEFFDFLSRGGQLGAELAALNSIEPAIATGRWDSAAQSNPAAVEFYAEAQLWQSHFEKAAPALGAESVVFAGDSDLGERATAAYRSLAYSDPRNTHVAVSAAARVAANDPTSRDALASSQMPRLIGIGWQRSSRGRRNLSRKRRRFFGIITNSRMRCVF